MWNLITSIKPTLEKEKHIYNYGQGFWIYVAKKLGLNLESKGNDLVVVGTDRKISGFATDMSYPKSIFMNCFFSEKLPTNVDLNKLFILPPEKFQYKKVNNPKERVSSLENETGKVFSQEWLEKTIIEYFNTIGITLEKSDFTEEEKEVAKKLEDKHLSEEWIIYGREKPDFY
jgi:lipoate-protein ligase A